MAASKDIAVLSQPQNTLSPQQSIEASTNIYPSSILDSISTTTLLLSIQSSSETTEQTERHGSLAATERSLLGVEHHSDLVADPLE